MLHSFFDSKIGKDENDELGSGKEAPMRYRWKKEDLTCQGQGLGFFSSLVEH